MSSNSTASAFSSSSIGTIDIIVIVIYLVFCLATGIWATLRTDRGSVSGYFLAGRDMLWFAIGASLFSSNIGSGSFVGLAGTGAANGIAVASYELNGLFCLLLMGWFFVPIYISSGVFTLPEYLMRRFGGQRLQIYMSVLALLIYVFTKISVDMFAGTIFIQQAVGWDLYAGVFLLLGISALYTISGGLKAVMYTDTLQTVIMVAGSLVLMVISYVKVGGIEKIYAEFHRAIPDQRINGSTCGIPPANAFHLLRDASSADLPWPGNVFGITILSAWYFCCDQVLVQRTLSAKNMHHVKGGSILGAYLKILPLFTTVFPGMISRILFKDQVGCVDPKICKQVCDNEAGCTNIAYPKLVVELMPEGLKGLMLAAMMAALMSSLTSVFNSTSTIFTMDIWRRIRPRSSDGELLVVGRLFVLVLVVVSIIWIPVLQASQGGQLFNYIQSVSGYLVPPVLSLFLLAILWSRTNESGAFWGLMVGLLVGLIRLGLDFGYGSPACGEEEFRPSIIAKVHFLHFTIILFFISLFTTIIVSILTPPIHPQHLVRLTWWTRHSTIERVPFKEEEKTNKIYEEAKQNRITELKEKPKVVIPRWKSVVYLICGYKPPKEVLESEENNEVKKSMLIDIREVPKWKMFVNINGILLMTIGMFLWGFFA
ncbi:sodium/glucose cotransporter 4-like [Pecten maximus]|uniref:sodium/glucose cotransporter 4-like n=1 Tax=Pecten maximus TaxID=6579 RepID=UPI0014586A44|nr:sodium/glucose cotransporter 4-like [Pecten maximus]